MALDITSTTKEKLRLAGLGLVAAILFVVAVLLAYYSLTQRGSLPSLSSYKYTISQSVNNSVEYAENSYYPNGPGVDNTAFVTELTKSFDTNFHYSYSASEAKELRYTYEVTASVKGMYGVPGSEEDASNVWAEHFELLKPVTKTVTAKNFIIDETVTVPFEEYRKLVEDFRLGLTLPVNSELELKLVVKVEGTVSGESFKDTRTSTVSAPLNVQIYQLASKYDKSDTKEVASGDSIPLSEKWRTQIGFIVAIVAAILGGVCIYFAARSNSEKSAYERKLEKIYRYHDGIIIRTRQPAKLSANKSIVPVDSFDDILNLEEETKSPIIASPAGATATRFMVADGDIVYIYVLGKEPTDLIVGEELQSIEDSLAHHTKVAAKKRPLGGHAVRKQTKK